MQISEQKILKDRNIYMESEYFDMSGNISQIIYMYYTKLNIINFFQRMSYFNDNIMVQLQ